MIFSCILRLMGYTEGLPIRPSLDRREINSSCLGKAPPFSSHFQTPETVIPCFTICCATQSKTQSLCNPFPVWLSHPCWLFSMQLWCYLWSSSESYFPLITHFPSLLSCQMTLFSLRSHRKELKSHHFWWALDGVRFDCTYLFFFFRNTWTTIATITRE